MDNKKATVLHATNQLTICLLAVGAALFSGCTTIGLHNAELRESMDFGPPVYVNFCVLMDKGISEKQLPWLYLKGISSGEMGSALEVLIGTVNNFETHVS